MNECLQRSVTAPPESHVFQVRLAAGDLGTGPGCSRLSPRQRTADSGGGGAGRRRRGSVCVTSGR